MSNVGRENLDLEDGGYSTDEVGLTPIDAEEIQTTDLNPPEEIPTDSSALLAPLDSFSETFIDIGLTLFRAPASLMGMSRFASSAPIPSSIPSLKSKNEEAAENQGTTYGSKQFLKDLRSEFPVSERSHSEMDSIFKSTEQGMPAHLAIAKEELKMGRKISNSLKTELRFYSALAAANATNPKPLSKVDLEKLSYWLTRNKNNGSFFPTELEMFKKLYKENSEFLKKAQFPEVNVDAIQASVVHPENQNLHPATEKFLVIQSDLANGQPVSDEDKKYAADYIEGGGQTNHIELDVESFDENNTSVQGHNVHIHTNQLGTFAYARLELQKLHEEKLSRAENKLAEEYQKMEFSDSDMAEEIDKMKLISTYAAAKAEYIPDSWYEKIAFRKLAKDNDIQVAMTHLKLKIKGHKLTEQEIAHYYGVQPEEKPSAEAQPEERLPEENSPAQAPTDVDDIEA